MYNRILEYIVLVSGILAVYLTYKRNFWGFVIGCINTGLFAVVNFFCYNLYGQAVLYFYYTVMNVLGIIKWSKKRGDNTTDMKVSYTSKNDIIKNIFYLAILWIGIYFLLKNFPGNNFVFLDSTITAISYVAMWLLIKCKIENWILWVVVNILSFVLFLLEGSYIYSLQFLILMALALVAIRNWHKKYKSQNV